MKSKVPITFLHAEKTTVKTIDNPENGFVTENDTLDGRSGDSDTG